MLSLNVERWTLSVERLQTTSSGMNEQQKPRIIIVGAGFGGLEAAKKLACEDVRVTVIDRANYHLFQPLLYQVATAALSPADIAAPIRAILSTCKNMEVILAEVQSVDVDAKKVKTADGIELTYDFLVLAKDFRHIDPSQARVIVVEGESRLLAAFPEDLSASALKQLVDLGVEVRTGIHATNLTEGGLQVGDEFIPCRVKIWAAGNNASFVGKTLGVAVDRIGRVLVNDDLTIPNHPEVQVIGDLANFSHQTGKPLPGVSPVAMQQGRHAARNILVMVRGEKPQRFHYWDKGSMATIGRNKAVADLRFVHLKGLPAWLAWLFVHIIFLVGFRNRVAVLFEWAWAYFSFNKGARLITRNFQAEQRPPT